jgi:hypothetical protein
MSNLIKVQSEFTNRAVDINGQSFYDDFCNKLFEYYIESNTGLNENDNDSYITYLTFVIEDVLSDIEITDADCDLLIQFINKTF